MFQVGKGNTFSSMPNSSESRTRFRPRSSKDQKIAVRTACVLGFVAKSAEKKLPVLIAESFPRFVGTAGGAASWDGWFAPFFDTLLRQPAVKGWSYIDRGARSPHSSQRLCGTVG